MIYEVVAFPLKTVEAARVVQLCERFPKIAQMNGSPQRRSIVRALQTTDQLDGLSVT